MDVAAPTPADLARLIADADAARDRRDWAVAEARYAAVVAARPADAGMWMQLGHARREGGNGEGAADAYSRALVLDRGDPEAHLFLGHALRLAGERARAVAAYAQAARLAPGYADPVRELVALGARDAVPGAASEALRHPTRAAAALAAGPEALRDWQALAGYRRADWDRFRRDLPVRPPPGPLPDGRGVVVLVDARGRPPGALAATFRALDDQSVRGWRAEAWDWSRSSAAGETVLLDAGTLPHPDALAWLLFALRRTGAPAAWCDWDRAEPHPLLGLVHSDPRLGGAFDPEFTLAGGVPALVAASGPLPPEPDGAGLRAALLLAAAPRVAHVPRVLATVTGAPSAAAPLRAAPSPPGGPVAVVIPTRDRPDLLARALAALVARADDPARVRPVIVNNGDPIPPPPGALVVDAPGPFNWSRANNLGVAAAPADADLLLFLNDDAELVSPGWDTALAAALARPGVGAVGARLLYPDTRVQHAGMVLGGAGGRPEHEGRFAAFDDPGPDRRWVSRRLVAAVTGACLGTTRGWLARTGGFDERLAVAYNDLDYALRVRAAGGLVLYEPAIEAVHREGATRGRVPSAEARARDDAELAHLVARWGAAVADDPGVSPYWTRHARPLDGLREPPMHEIIQHMDRTGAGTAWVPEPRES